MEYEYYDFDNAIYRVRANSGLHAVDDVWTPVGWEPYTGDRTEKWMFGDRIDPTRLPPAAREKSGRSNLINLTDEAKGRAFQILSAPRIKKPK